MLNDAGLIMRCQPTGKNTMNDLTPEITTIIVNDQKSVAQMWQRVLNMSKGVQCLGIALDGEQAINMTLELRPRVVVMDVMMPVVHGFEATQRIMELMPETLVIIYSARQDIEEEAFAAGAVECLRLPLMPTELIDTIRRVVSKADSKI